MPSARSSIRRRNNSPIEANSPTFARTTTLRNAPERASATTNRLGNQTALAHSGQPNYGDRTVATGAEYAACNGAQFGFSPDESRFRNGSAKISVRIGTCHVGQFWCAINQSLNRPTRRR